MSTRHVRNAILTTLFSATVMTYPGCQNVLASDTNSEEQTVQSEKERLDDLIESYTGELLDFPMDYNKSLFDDTGEQRTLTDYVASSDISYLRGDISYADQSSDLYEYGDTVVILTDERRDAEYVGRALEILKRREPTFYNELIGNPEPYDYTVFSFVENAHEYGDWATQSDAKSAEHSSTGNHVRFIFQDRGDIIGTNQSSLPPAYKDGLSDDEIYDNLMKDKFLTMIVHESLHGVYTHDYPADLFWDDNSNYESRLEHVNIYTIQHEVADRIDSADVYVDWLSRVVQLQYEYLIDQGFSEQRMQDVVTYRPF